MRYGIPRVYWGGRGSGGGGGGKGKKASRPASFEKPEDELIQRRILLAMALDKTRNPNNADTSNIFRNLKAEKALKSFDIEHPEVIGWLTQTFGKEDLVIPK